MLKSSRQSGFSVVEIMVSLMLVSLLLGVMYAVIQNSMTLNAKSKLRATASSLAFEKVQDYLNQSYDNIPIGDIATAYEVEDYSAEVEAENFNNVVAKVYSEPESVIPGSTTTTTTHSQVVSADTSFVSGSEINSIDEDDATGDWYRIWRLSDNNYRNYTYSRFAGSPDNLASPSIDLGSSTIVDTIRVNWFACGYGASDYRVEAKNSSPQVNSGWTTIVSGLSDNGIPCFSGNHPQDIDVSSNSTPYRYWRLYFVDAENYYYSVVSELEAFSAGTPGDTVEQQGSDASDTPGKLYFSSSDLEMSEDGNRGHQSIGMIFDAVDTPQGATIEDAYLEFTADESNSGSVTLLVKAADVDSASPWTGNFAVDNAVDNDGSDGSVGTSASVTWTPSAWSAGENGNDTRVEVTTIVQELVDRLGWTAGNNMAFTVQYISGSDRRVAERYPGPELLINWTEESLIVAGDYVDVDGDGDVDNPTLLRITTLIEYDAFGQRFRSEYATFVRKFGVSD